MDTLHLEKSENNVDYLREGYENLTYFALYVGYIIQTYGWHMLFAGLVFYYVYTKFVKPLLQSLLVSWMNYKKKREEYEYDALYHKNPDLVVNRMMARQEAAQKLQDKYNQQAKEYQEKLREKEERKRQEVLNLLNDSGHRLGDGAGSSNGNKSFKPEYHPLMGPGSSSNYRPPKKSKCGGGGCGK